ncbi:hypothetical protein G6F32_014376 [Rhizopus arrhizus]|nr:hypothetical protein G6F32_014376 [Rhizopus arrhizus]
MGGAGAQRRDQEHQRRDDQYAAAPQAIPQPAGQEGADRAAQQHRSNFETQCRFAGVEGLAQAIDRAIDDTTVKTEQESTEGGHATDQDDERGVLTAVRGGAGLGLGHGRSCWKGNSATPAADGPQRRTGLAIG